jgi:hypothetical protein
MFNMNIIRIILFLISLFLLVALGKFYVRFLTYSDFDRVSKVIRNLNYYTYIHASKQEIDYCT